MAGTDRRPRYLRAVEPPEGQSTTLDSLILGPRSVERPTDAGSTLVAGVDGIAPARVDGGGLVTPHGAGWSLDWWIGADDRWHLPAREASIRQRRIGHGPIIETSLRVPSGDVVHTVHPVVFSTGTATVIEIRNDSPVPVALALAIRPYTVDDDAAGHRTTGRGHTPTFELSNAASVVVDGELRLLLPRRPNEAGAVTDRDLLETIRMGGPLVWTRPIRDPGGNAACLYPLPHRTSLRFAVITPTPGAPSVAPPPLDSLPDAGAAARGWTAVIDRASAYEFPDDGLSALAGAARARLVLAASDLPAAVEWLRPGAGMILEGLAAGGHRSECRRSVERFAGSFPTDLPASASGPTAAASVAWGLALAAQCLGDGVLDERLLEPLTQLTHLVERSGDRGAGGLARLALAVLADRTAQPEAAEGLRLDVAPDRFRSTADLAAVTALAATAAPARRWNDPGQPADPTGTGVVDRPPVDSAAMAARFWLAARDQLLRPADPGRGATIEVLPRFPAAWRGGSVEVHRAPVAGVLVSFALRWHGFRPALLWDVVDARPAAMADRFGPPTLTCPGLDPRWRTSEPTGEALLAGTATDLPAAPEPGDSFT